MLPAMGFSTALSTSANVIPSIFDAIGAFGQSKAQRKAAAEQKRLAAQQAAAIQGIASQNQMRGARNAHAREAQARVDAAVSNTMQDGSTYRRGVDLATRLQDEINAQANEQLNRADSIRRQGAYDAWDLRNQAKQSRFSGIGAAASGVGSLFGALATGLGQEKK